MTTPIPELIAQGEALLKNVQKYSGRAGEYPGFMDALRELREYLVGHAPAIFAHIKAQDERIARLHGALRKFAITRADPPWNRDVFACDVCGQLWWVEQGEKHAPDCLAQRQEPKP